MCVKLGVRQREVVWHQKKFDDVTTERNLCYGLRFFSILSWSTFISLFKTFAEISMVVKTNGITNLGNVNIGFFKQCSCQF